MDLKGIITLTKNEDFYIIGPGDLMLISVSDDYPELITKTRVSGEGTIILPSLGTQYVENLTIKELESLLNESYKKYEERLASTVPARPKMNIFQAAAAMGRGLLSTPNTGVGSMYQGLGVGFDNISQKIEKDQAMYEQEKRDVARLATQMALEDERQAEKYLQDYFYSTW